MHAREVRDQQKEDETRLLDHPLVNQYRGDSGKFIKSVKCTYSFCARFLPAPYLMKVLVRYRPRTYSVSYLTAT